MKGYAFHPEARLEYLEAARFYEQRKPGLGAQFSRVVEAAVARIVEAPERWPEMELGVRRYLTPTFPYGILYTTETDGVLIVAVMHCRRRPGYWKDRWD